MTANYFLKCPICNAITHMRSPAGYIARTPVRIHCGNCTTLMTGEFVSDERSGTCSFVPKNCEQVPRTQSDFYSEASGEVPVHKTCPQEEDLFGLPPFLSPALLCMDMVETEVLEDYIDYACHISELAVNWDSRMILYNLLLMQKCDLIRSKYADCAKKWMCDLTEEYGIQKFVHLEYLYDFGYIFGKTTMKNLLTEINYEIIHFDKSKLKEMTDDIFTTDRVHDIQSKMFKIMEGYMSIALYVMPALSTFFLKDGKTIDKEDYGISTCSFSDIKNFYLDAFESLASCCDIIKCLDNIKHRDRYNNFGTKMTVDNFRFHTKNGNKVKELVSTEFFSSAFALSNDAYELRNAIGHNEYEYDGFRQKIHYRSNKQEAENKRCAYLIDIARECISLMRSSIVLEFIVFELIRERYRTFDTALCFHPIFYSKTKSQSRCPCGSGKKYGKCCKSMIANMQHIQSFELPHRANMRMSIGGFC